MAEVYIEEAGLFSSGAAYGQQHEPRQILAVACSWVAQEDDPKKMAELTDRLLSTLEMEKRQANPNLPPTKKSSEKLRLG